MASSSSSNIMAANGSNYDVFLSFRGEDTRNSFTDHLYEALKRAGLRTFRDNDEIDRGEELKPEIERAIKESRASIVVLSENYATSTWCLDELLLILDQRREYNQLVLPVFYHVDPSEVRKQDKTFKMEVELSSRWTEDKVNRWKVALTKVADLTGVVLSGLETNIIKDIVDTIYNKLDSKQVYLPPNLIGMYARVQEINYWLKQSDVNFLLITGMGGSGKSTLAKHIYDLYSKFFESVSFIEDIGSTYDRGRTGQKRKVELQQQLFNDILGGKKRKIPSVSQGTFKIEQALRMKRALIVLDDIVSYDELKTLIGTGKINAESKIIITTREYTRNWFEMTSWRCQEYKMRLLNDDESLELLSHHAFGSKIPMEGFNELAAQAIQYCEGNPLALEVLGSSLSNSNTIPYWDSQLKLLEKDFHGDILNVLIRSYNSLPYDTEKELFLHIACFFVGKDMDYVAKILEPDYSAVSGIKTLANRCLLSISPNKKLVMHRLIQAMGRNLVRQEAFRYPEQRSRVWDNDESHKILSRGMGSVTMEGLALDMQKFGYQSSTNEEPELKTSSLKRMDNLKLLQLNYVSLVGSYHNISQDLRWLCWHGFHLKRIPSYLLMGKLVALDMSFSSLEVFNPPMVLQSLQILNLQGSENLFEICNISLLPNLGTLILWNCKSLVRVCETIRGLTSLALLNITGCTNLCKRENAYDMQSVGAQASTSGGRVTKQPIFSLPHSLQRLFLNDCNLECTNNIPLHFIDQPFLQYLNLSNSLFEFLPCYDHLKNLRVLDLSFCSKLKCLLCLPNTLAELYIYHCQSLEKIAFQTSRFTLQEIGYEGCINLYEIEGFIKLIPIAKLNESDLGHMKWLKEYQSHEVFLVGDDELTVGRIRDIQMLYEFGIMSTSLPEIKDPNMISEYMSESPSLSFDVPSCPKNRRLMGLNVTFKYIVSSDDWVWFAKIRTTNGVDLMYNPKVFGRPRPGEVGIWLSYWPIATKLDVGDKVYVSIVVMSGLLVKECGASLVYFDDEVADEILEKNIGWVETLGGDLSAFQLSTGGYYLCRRDFFEFINVERLNPGWFSILFGDAIDYTGWRKTGRPTQLKQSFTELKAIRCMLDGPEMMEIYDTAEMSKSSFADKTKEFTSSTLKEMEIFGTTSKALDKEMDKDMETNKDMDTEMDVDVDMDELCELDDQTYEVDDESE